MTRPGTPPQQACRTPVCRGQSERAMHQPSRVLRRAQATSVTPPTGFARWHAERAPIWRAQSGKTAERGTGARVEVAAGEGEGEGDGEGEGEGGGGGEGMEDRGEMDGEMDGETGLEAVGRWGG